MLELEPGQIDLWLTFTHDDVAPELMERYRRLVAADERHRAQHFRFAKDRRRYMVTRALMRTTLSRYAPIAPDEWIFSENEWGKPHIANTVAEAQRLSFNVSHTDGLIVLAVTRDRACGVDAESVCARQACFDVAHRFFSADETRALFALPPTLRSERFFDYWTLKEAYIKARGMGLSIPLDQFSFAFQPAGRVRLSVQVALMDSSSRWRFWQCRASTEHIIAVCAERLPTTHDDWIRARRVVPLLSESACDVTLLRRSD